MRFLCLYKPADTKSAEAGLPPCPEEMAEMGKLIEEMTKSGALLATEGCLPSANGARVRLSKGKVTVTDGPFTEAKELIAGFALIEAKSKAEAIELAKRFLEVAGDGENEIRQVYDGAHCSADIFPPEHAARAQVLREDMQRNAANR